MIKVLFLIPTLGHGGAERVLVNLVNNLDRNIFDVTVQTLFDEGVYKKSLLPGIRYKSFMKHQFHGNSWLFAAIPKRMLFRHIVRESHDIIVSYLEGPTAHVLAGCTAPATKRVAWIHTELGPKIISQGFCSCKAAISAYTEMDRLVFVSKKTKETFEKTAKRMISNAMVLYNTIETDAIVRRANDPVSDVVFSREVINVISVSKIMQIKGFDRLASVHKRLLDEGIRHRIYIIGVGEKQGEIEGYLEKQGLQDTFTFIGYRDNPYKYVAAADVYVCASRREGFSTAVTESLIVGTPVVSTCCSGAYELLGEPDPCLRRPEEDSAYELCEFGIVTENSEQGIYEGLKKMLTDTELRRHYAQQAKLRGQRFSTEKTVRAVEEMLLELYEEK